MKAQTIHVKNSRGRILCCAIVRAGGKKLLAKGHMISEEDTRMLETEGMNEVWVTELEEGEVGEDEAVMQVASEIGCGWRAISAIDRKPKYRNVTAYRRRRSSRR